MIVDVSHLSDAGFYDVVKYSTKPFVASHSNCRALCPATRNLTDEMIRVLGNCGAVAGINFEPSFLNADIDDKFSRIEGMCDHILHLIDKGGAECVGIGTDFDGIEGCLEIGEPTQMEYLVEGLRKVGFTQDEVDRIAWKNALRVLCDIAG